LIKDSRWSCENAIPFGTIGIPGHDTGDTRPVCPVATERPAADSQGRKERINTALWLKRNRANAEVARPTIHSNRCFS